MNLPTWALIILLSIIGYSFTLWKTKPTGRDPFGYGRFITGLIATVVWIIILLGALLLNEWLV